MSNHSNPPRDGADGEPNRIRKLKRTFPDVKLLVEVQPSVLDGIVRVINAELDRMGIENARVTRIGQRLVLDGTVMDETEKKRAESIVEALYGSVLDAIE